MNKSKQKPKSKNKHFKKLSKTPITIIGVFDIKIVNFKISINSIVLSFMIKLKYYEKIDS